MNGGEAHTTNNRMELIAAISALEALKRPCVVDLHTDSEYLRNGITSGSTAGRRTAGAPPTRSRSRTSICGNGSTRRSSPTTCLALGEGPRGPRRERARRPARARRPGGGARRRGWGDEVEVIAPLFPAKAGTQCQEFWIPACAGMKGNLPLRLLNLREQRVAAGNVALAGRVLDVERLDRAVVDQHRVALRARAEPVAGAVEVHADALGEFAVAVGQKFDFAGGAGRLLPGFHDEGVVDAGDRDGVDALGLEGVDVVEEARDVQVVAGRREGAGRTANKATFLPLKMSSVVFGLLGPSAVMARNVALGNLSPTLMGIAVLSLIFMNRKIA